MLSILCYLTFIELGRSQATKLAFPNIVVLISIARFESAFARADIGFGLGLVR